MGKRRAGSLGKGTKSDRGQASEHFVACDLLVRGLKATKPLNTNGDDDLHAECSVGWITIQVKTGSVNLKTGRLSLAGGKRKIKSDVLALVDLVERRIEYRPAAAPVPYELTDAYIALNPED